jgi:hypothetical protein
MSVSGNDIKFKAISGTKLYKFRKKFYFLNVVVGTFLIVLEVELYRKTIIDFYIPLIVILVVGTAAFLFNKRHYQKVYALQGIFFPLIQNIFSWGFIACYLFMATNYYFTDTDTRNHKFPIKYKSSLPGGKGHQNERQPLVAIDYFGFEKELVFRFSQTGNVEQADSVILKTSRGILGFDVLVDYNLLQKSLEQ